MIKSPSSFSTICTKQCKQELFGFLLSLSLHHPNTKTYVLCDTETLQYIKESTPQPKLEIKWFVELDKYSIYSRQEMEKIGIWSDFQMCKARIIQKVLNYEIDTLFLDSDTIILDKLEVDTSKQLGVSPQFIKQTYVDKYGYYNGGMLWTNQKTLPDKWIYYTKKSRFFDQASIEDLTKEYSYFEFSENYNLQTWRFLLGIDDIQTILSYLNIKDDKIYYKDERLKFVHTHFNQQDFNDINNFLIELMKQAKLWRELAIVHRVIHNKWMIYIPKQPQPTIFFHKNDSFRELLLLMKGNNKDLDILYIENTVHCWLEPNILLYDRPSLDWVNNEVLNSSIVLLGNCDVDYEGNILKSKGVVNIQPWIFWPRRPVIVEKILKQNLILDWNERSIQSIFIGNYENPVQEKYRKTSLKWENVISEYHITKGEEHKFTHTEYLMKLRDSKYGLCLRGYGSKCHREVELMAFGTVPIITPDVCIKSYCDPPIENVHYIFVKTPEELQEKMSKIGEKQWREMSKACYEWYKRNIHSKNVWNTMITNILYK